MTKFVKSASQDLVDQRWIHFFRQEATVLMS